MYQIILTNGTTLVNIPDNTLDHSTSLTLIGKDYVGYGTNLTDNLVHLLENAANGTGPVAPLVGQLWYNTDSETMNVWNGSAWIVLGAGGVVSVVGATGVVTLANLTTGGVAALASPALTGTPTAPTATSGTNTTQIATTAFVATATSVSALTTEGMAPAASPALTGTPTAPTAASGTNTTQIATTAFVTTAASVSALTTEGMAPAASPTLTGTPIAPTATAGNNTTQIATTAFVTSAIAGISGGSTNLLINPLLNVQQMNAITFGPSGTNLNNIYLNDGWLVNCTGVPSMTTSVVNVTDSSRATIGDESAQYAFHIQTTGVAGANDYALFSQRLENNYQFSNKYLVFSFWGYPSVAGSKICVEFAQFFGSGGVSATVTGIGQVPGTITMASTGWTYYSTQPILIPSVTGKTFGAPNTDYLALRIWLTAGTTIGTSTANNIGVQQFSLIMWNPQLEFGSVATQAIHRSISTELALCQRYYESSYWEFASYGTTSGTIGMSIPFKVSKRITPTMTINSGSGLFNAGTLTTGPSVTGDAFQMKMNVTSTGMASAGGSWVADARL